MTTDTTRKQLAVEFDVDGVRFEWALSAKDLE